MLVLTRKLNERIVVGDNITITVVGIRGNHVRLGIEAPPEVSILREELQRFDAANECEPHYGVGRPQKSDQAFAAGMQP
jgi:carbon storage regulator